MPAIEVFAPAKVNLALHVTGQRADGYHLLDSLVAFAPVGDVVRLWRADAAQLQVSGPEAAGVPSDGRNLVVQALRHHAQACGLNGHVAMHLQKNLPAASGIGGGSSDAAAAVRGAMALYETPELSFQGGILRVQTLGQVPASLSLLALGADVPMCYRPETALIRGIGEELVPVALPPLPAVLVNPRVEVPTPAVFKALPQKENPCLPELPAFATAAACMAWLAEQRNDLQAPAIAAAPVIADVLAALAATPGCRFARMSGSGATCFGLYETAAKATAAAATLGMAHPAWWCAGGTLEAQSGVAAAKRL